MAFLGPNDILVLQKSEGTVQRIVSGKMLPEPVLRVPVVNNEERGMLGIGIAKHAANITAKNQPMFSYIIHNRVEEKKVMTDSKGATRVYNH